MEIETSFIDVEIELTGESLIIKSPENFLSISTSKIGGGVSIARFIVNYNLESASYPGSLPELEVELGEKHGIRQLTVLPSNGIDKIINLTREEATVIIITDKSLKLNCIILIDACLYESSLMSIFRDVLEYKASILGDLHVKRSGVSADELVLACRTGDKPLNDEETQKVKSDVLSCVHEATSKLLNSVGYPQDILGHIKDAGVTINDLIEAAMELVVGVERTAELDLKLNEQIVKSLEDLNVATLIMAGIRLEEDLSLGIIKGINVEDDPAYLYSDEVLGMAIANQIAGTKAIFNFKRYDEEKPGIIGELGPVLDDVFAGLIAGCMSRIFEE